MRRFPKASLGLCFVFFAACMLSAGRLALAQQPATMVIDGGTLIDGNGGIPLKDSVIVIQGNKIANVFRKGQGPYPANATIIKADGKFIVPGLFDAQVGYAWFFGEAMLNNGVTSTIDVGNRNTGEVAAPYREAVFHGKVLGPRTFTSISRFAAGPPNGEFDTEMAQRTPKSVRELRDYVRLWIAAGADYLAFYDGGLPLDYYKAAIEEANAAGKAVIIRPNGPTLFPKDASILGAAALPHSAGVGGAVSKTSPTGPPDSTEYTSTALDFYADMDEAKAKDLIQVLVQHKTALVPTFKATYPGYQKDWARFEEEDRKLFSDPSLRAYFPPDVIVRIFARYNNIDRGAIRERRMKGYQNLLRFHKMFVDAGGHLVLGSNTNPNTAPGNNLHHELQIAAEEAGIAPMQVVQGATKWAAEMIRKQDIVGTVETGKLADMVIVNQDPLQNIRNLQKIDSVIFNGKIVDRTYHAWYTSPFLNEADFSPVVEDLPWVAALKRVTVSREGSESTGSGVELPNPIAAPQPGIETVSPVIVTEGSPTLTLTLKGFNFVRGSQVYFDGRSVPYRPVSPTELVVTLDTSLLLTAGRFNIVVKNPQPLDRFAGSRWGDGTSNKAHLIVNYGY